MEERWRRLSISQELVLVDGGTNAEVLLKPHVWRF
jgi:hypothetical protein